MAIDSPGLVPAVFVTAPKPVVTEHPISAAMSRGMSLLILIAELSGTTKYGAYVAGP
ncbi:unannotated protein [freshwater metagenome]|uniref:Unannotated protein n=1 Tax=freshwater metagenome TaxID=449393 RepID=A0A6J6TGS6_9ZZZZ